MNWNYETCSAAAAKFKTKAAFRENANKEFQWLRRNELLDAACAHMVSLRRDIGDADITAIAGRYTHRRAFKLGDQSAYNAATKRGILDLVCAHMQPVRRTLSNEQIAEIAGRYLARAEFVRNDNGAYQSAIKRGILDDVCAHMDGKGDRRLSDDEILGIAKQFTTRNDFKLGDFGAYTTAIRRDLIAQACAHMEYGAWGFREDRPAVLYRFRIQSADGLVLYKIGITNRKPKQRLLTMGLHPGAKADLLDAIRFNSGRDARIAEKRLHRKYAAHRYNGPPVMKNGNTELFTVSVLEL